MNHHLPEVTHFWASVPWMLLLGKCSLDAPLGSAESTTQCWVLNFDVAKSLGNFNSTLCHCISFLFSMPGNQQTCSQSVLDIWVKDTISFQFYCYLCIHPKCQVIPHFRELTHSGPEK